MYDFRQRNVLSLIAEGIDGEARFRHSTGWGVYDLGVSVSRKTRFDQNFAGGTTFSVLNTTGFNGTFPSIKLDLRADAGFEYGPFGATVFVNHTGKYRNWGANAVNPVVSVGGVPTGGGDPVKAYTTFDLHLSYKLPRTGFLPKGSIYLDVVNLFDKKPAFYNSAQGYDTFTGNPLLRVATVGIRARW